MLDKFLAWIYPNDIIAVLSGVFGLGIMNWWFRTLQGWNIEMLPWAILPGLSVIYFFKKWHPAQ